MTDRWKAVIEIVDIVGYNVIQYDQTQGPGVPNAERARHHSMMDAVDPLWIPGLPTVRHQTVSGSVPLVKRRFPPLASQEELDAECRPMLRSLIAKTTLGDWLAGIAIFALMIGALYVGE